MTNPETGGQQAKLEKLLASRIGKFTPPQYLRTGGVRNLYRTNIGPNGEIQGVAKVERADVESPRAKRHLERGCTTESEIRHVIGLDAPGVTKMIDYFSAEEAAQYGIDGAVIVEEFRPNAISLEEHVSQNGPLNKKQLRQFTRKYAETVRAVRKRGILHRDQKPSNILLEFDERGNVSDVFLTDWANAARLDEIRPSAWPTAGGHDATHPKIMPTFVPRAEGETPEELRYDDQCEIYGMAHNIALAARGRRIFSYDPDRATAIAWDTGQSVLTNGKRDAIKHNLSLGRGTRKLPSDLRSLVRDGMAIDSPSAYETVEQFTLNAIHAAREPSTWVQRGKWAGLAATVALAIGGAGFAIHQVEKANEEVQKTSQSLEYEKKVAAIRQYLGEKAKDRWNVYIEEGEIDGWINFLGDEKTGLAAYMDPDKTFEAIAETGSRDFKDLEDYFYRHKDWHYALIPNAINVDAPGGNVDSICRIMRGDRFRGVNERWEQARSKYEERKAAEARQMQTISGAMTYKQFPSGSPMLGDLTPTTQPTTKPSDYWPAPKNP
jgi:serine/threonine protein kinase